MTETNAEATAAQPGTPEVAGDHTADGRYIPYGGGILGWFENSGILKKELANNYKFNTVLDIALVRKKQFDRWGEVQNRRAEDRVRVIPEVKVTLIYGKEKREATTKDLSAHGMRMQFLEELSIKKGDIVKVGVHDPVKKKVALEVDANVMWMEKSGKLRAVWNMGIGFPTLSEEQSADLTKILLHRR
jgi:hypothetical protein